jgi:hypothetical protein
VGIIGEGSSQGRRNLPAAEPRFLDRALDSAQRRELSFGQWSFERSGVSVVVELVLAK